MTRHLHRELERLKRNLLSLSARAEESVRSAVRALTERDDSLAGKVIDSDFEIDQREVELEEDCLKVLALHQPVAGDLRLIVAVLKINNDLERIGDLAVNIAERAQFLATHEPLSIPNEIPGMADRARQMVKDSLDALVNADPDAARRVCAADDEVDALNREMYLQVQRGIRARPEEMERLIHLLSASRHLERIADHATNIAEDVIYMTEGQIVRHHAERYDAQMG